MWPIVSLNGGILMSMRWWLNAVRSQRKNWGGQLALLLLRREKKSTLSWDSSLKKKIISLWHCQLFLPVSLVLFRMLLPSPLWSPWRGYIHNWRNTSRWAILSSCIDQSSHIPDQINWLSLLAPRTRSVPMDRGICGGYNSLHGSVVQANGIFHSWILVWP